MSFAVHFEGSNALHAIATMSRIDTAVKEAGLQDSLPIRPSSLFDLFYLRSFLQTNSPQEISLATREGTLVSLMPLERLDQAHLTSYFNVLGKILSRFSFRGIPLLERLHVEIRNISTHLKANCGDAFR